MNNTVNLDIGALLKNEAVLHLRITGMRRFTLRMKLATWLLSIVALVLPMGVKVTAEMEGR